MSERSTIDISDKLKITSESLETLIKSLHQDMHAYDSCLSLFVTESKIHSNTPIQLARKSKIQEFESEKEELKNQIRVRNENESYIELVEEIRQVQKSLLSVETIQGLVGELQNSQKNALAKLKSWFKSVTAFIFQLASRFTSYSDVWAPLIFGCSLVMLGKSFLLRDIFCKIDPMMAYQYNFFWCLHHFTSKI